MRGFALTGNEVGCAVRLARRVARRGADLGDRQVGAWVDMCGTRVAVGFTGCPAGLDGTCYGYIVPGLTVLVVLLCDAAGRRTGTLRVSADLGVWRAWCAAGGPLASVRVGL